MNDQYKAEDKLCERLAKDINDLLEEKISKNGIRSHVRTKQYVYLDDHADSHPPHWREYTYSIRWADTGDADQLCTLVHHYGKFIRFNTYHSNIREITDKFLDKVGFGEYMHVPSLSYEKSQKVINREEFSELFEYYKDDLDITVELF